jgi:reverse gyrase
MDMVRHIRDAIARSIGVEVDVAGEIRSTTGTPLASLPEATQRRIAAAIIESATQQMRDGVMTGVMIGVREDGTTVSQSIKAADLAADFLRIKEFVERVNDDDEMTGDELNDFSMLAMSAMPTYIQAIERGAMMVRCNEDFTTILRLMSSLLLHIKRELTSDNSDASKVTTIKAALAGLPEDVLQNTLDKTKKFDQNDKRG